MAELIEDCPRCNAKKVTFDVQDMAHIGVRHEWKRVYESFCMCRHCKRSTVFVLGDRGVETKAFVEKTGDFKKLHGSLNNYYMVEGCITLKDRESMPPPEFLPADIEAVFVEGSKCFAIDCFNAAGTMFRLCVDLASQPLLPAEGQQPSQAVRRSLGLRLQWLFENQKLPEALRELAHCIKEDGNDGAHVGNLTKPDAEDLMDFTFMLLERLYTEPARIAQAKKRRDERRA